MVFTYVLALYLARLRDHVVQGVEVEGKYFPPKWSCGLRGVGQGRSGELVHVEKLLYNTDPFDFWEIHTVAPLPVSIAS